MDVLYKRDTGIEEKAEFIMAHPGMKLYEDKEKYWFKDNKMTCKKKPKK